jgi:hypothetical protein
MNIGTELWLFAVSLGASALGGMLGMASGIFIVPVLTMCCHRYTKRRRRQHRLGYCLFVQQRRSFSKGSFDECSTRNRIGRRQRRRALSPAFSGAALQASPAETDEASSPQG